MMAVTRSEIGEDRAWGPAALLRGWLHYLVGRRPPDPLLLLLSLLVAAGCSLPVVYVIWGALESDAGAWINLLSGSVLRLLGRTLLLALGVTALAVSLGTSLAVLVHRTDLPARRIWAWLLAVPLAIPSYIGAMVYIMLLGPRSVLSADVYSYWGAVLILGFLTYPYAFLASGAALKRMNPSLEEAARLQGLSPPAVLGQVSLPMILPAMAASALLVALYVLSDFGAVAMLRYSTFTTAIYYQTGSYDFSSASILSVVLILTSLSFLVSESLLSRRVRSHRMQAASFRPLLRLGRARKAAFLMVSLVFAVSAAIPAAALGYLTVVGLGGGIIRLGDLARYTGNSLIIAVSSALLAVVLALPVAYLGSRYPSPLVKLFEKLGHSAYSLPGVIVALGILFVLNRLLPALYNSPVAIAAAHTILFFPLALRGVKSSLSLVSPALDEGIRLLGFSPRYVLFRVIIPLASPGLLAGFVLVLVSSLKELPATLLLRPAGFDTLALRIWMESSEGYYYLASPYALVILLAALVPLKLILDTSHQKPEGGA